MARSLAAAPVPPARLDQALLADLGRLVSSGPLIAFLALEGVAALFITVRRGLGPGGLESVVLLWLGLCVLAFLAWWAGRHRRAVDAADPVGLAPGRLVAALVGALGVALVTWGVQVTIGLALVLGASVAWLICAWRGRGAGDGLAQQLLRDPRPFLPLLLLIALPRALATGPGYLAATIVALPSGLLQQLALLIGLFAPLEAVLGRTDRAAVLTALVFGALHVPMNLGQADGDLALAAANALVFQTMVGAIACLGFVRHRAAVPLGVAHALAMA